MLEYLFGVRVVCFGICDVVGNLSGEVKLFICLYLYVCLGVYVWGVICVFVWFVCES